MIDVNPNYLDTVTRILAGHVPECEVRAFGSRVTWTAKDYSDLDLAVVGERALDSDALRRLKEAFEESDLPFRVDVLDWHAISPAFRKVIEKKYEVVQKSKKKSLGMGGEWRDVLLEELAEDVTVGFVGPMASEYVLHGIPFLRSQNVEPLLVNDSDLKFITSTFHERLRKSALSPGDVVIVRTGKPGACAVIPSSLPVANCSDLVIVRCGPELDARFLAYYVNSVAVHHVDSHLVGAVQQHFNVGSARKLLMHLPSVTEQRAIAHILGTLDDKIEMNRRMNETLETMARALFKSWFVDFDPVRAKAEGRDPGLPQSLAVLFPDSFQDSELGEIPKGWCTSAAYDLATYVNGAAYRAFEPNEERRGLPIIKIAELKAGVTDQTRFSAVEMPHKYRIDTGDILFSWSGNPDTSIDIFVWTHGPAWLNQHIFRVVPNSLHERAFVLMTLRSLRPVFAEVARDKQTTGLGHVTAGDLKRLLVVRPPESVLLGWNTIVGSVLARSFGLEGESNTLAALRDTLLPKLISGELRVKDAERIIDGVALPSGSGPSDASDRSDRSELKRRGRGLGKAS